MAFDGIRTDSDQLKSFSRNISSEHGSYTNLVANMYNKVDELSSKWTTDAQNRISEAAYSNQDDFNELGNALDSYSQHLNRTAESQEGTEGDVSAMSNRIRN